MQMRKWMIFSFLVFIICLASPALAPSQAMAQGLLGHQDKKGCTKCHKDQYKSWQESVHGNAMESLKAGKKAKEKTKAKVDPKKDYTKDKDCLPCHTTSFNKGGFILGNKRKMKKFSNVGCESCHGGGKKYMKVKNKYKDDDFPRSEVIKAGMLYGEKKVCEKCHNDDSPFKPSVDPKYILDYEKDRKEGTHKHFKQKKHKPRKGSEYLYE